MISRKLTRRQALMACGMMLAAGVLAPQMVSACGMGRPPELFNVQVAPSETAATISFDTEYGRGATLVLWSDDASQSKRSFDDSSETTQHIFNVATLQPNTRYHYQIQLSDLGNDGYIAYAADLRTRPSTGQVSGDDSEDVTDQG